MTFPARAIAGLFGVAAGLGVSAAALHAGDRVSRPDGPFDRPAHVLSGAVARRVLLSFDALGADVYWIRTIQHYGRERKVSVPERRFELLSPLLDLTTSLDPQFNIAYRLGALLLAEPPPNGPGRADRAIGLLEKGLRHNPGRWQYAFDIGFIHYWYGGGHGRTGGDFAAAADWFSRAAAMPGAPIWLAPFAAATLAAGGDRQGARTLLLELSRSGEAWIRQAAARGLGQLAARETIDRLQQHLEAYLARHHESPASWTDLDPDLPPGAAPVDPSGVPYEYDPGRQRIVLSPRSSLFPLARLTDAR